MTHILCRGLLVDMDGVLVDSTPAVARVWSRWAHRHNMDPEYVVEFAHGRTSLASIRELLPHAEPAVHLTENQWMERAEIDDVADVIALPGAKELLAAVPADRLAVVTSATRPLAEVRLRITHLWEHIAHLVTASDIQRGKPDPEPYREAARRFALPAGSIVAVEDSGAGARSAREAGLYVVGYAPEGGALVGADRTIAKLMEVAALFKT